MNFTRDKMLFACKCLNVSVQCKSDEIRRVNPQELELNILERNDAFFKTDSLVTSELECIRKEQASLVQIRNVGSWAINYCSNCSMYTHAVHRELGAGMVLINNNIISSEENIRNLKVSRDFSPVFRIVIDQTKVNSLDPDEPPTKSSGSQLSINLRLALTSLEQQLDEAIRGQTAAIEEKIRAYTMEQYHILENFKERAHAEHHLLSKLVRDENDKLAFATRTNVQVVKPMLPNDAVNFVTNATSNKVPSGDKEVNDVNKPRAVNGKASKARDELDKNSPYDNETLFVLEGMDDPSQKLPLPPDHESDTDDSSDVIVPRVRSRAHSALAKSLPVTVPVFHQSFNHRQMIEDDEDEQIPRDPLDPKNIRASIKALAKSVHGDAVFGDLPRPRFSTQI